MNAPDTLQDPPDWWSGWMTLTEAQQDAMAEEYAREQIATAQSESAFEANIKEHNP
jgi:hypothetical protein